MRSRTQQAQLQPAPGTTARVLWLVSPCGCMGCLGPPAWPALGPVQGVQPGSAAAGGPAHCCAPMSRVGSQGHCANCSSACRISGASGGLATLVEKKSRRMELAIYCLSRALESFALCLVHWGLVRRHAPAPPSREVAAKEAVHCSPCRSARLPAASTPPRASCRASFLLHSNRKRWCRSHV